MFNREEIKHKFDNDYDETRILKTESIIGDNKEEFEIIVTRRIREIKRKYFFSFFLHIFSIKDPKAKPKIIYISTVASREWRYIPDYLKIPNGLVLFKRDQKLQIDSDGESFKF